MSFVSVLGVLKIHSFRASVTSRLLRQQPSLSFPLFVADRLSGYVRICVSLVSLANFVSPPPIFVLFLQTRPSV